MSKWFLNYDLSEYFKHPFKSRVEKYNLSIKSYPGGNFKVKYFKKPIYTGLCQFRRFSIDSVNIPNLNRIRIDSIKRKKDNIYDIAISNNWNYFITLTISPDLLDRSDYSLCLKKLSQFLNNYKKADSSFKYLIVPELHSDNESVHFHGLIFCSDAYMVDSGVKTKNGDVIFNWFKWSYGFSTATKINNIDAISKYITKYLTKNNISLKGRRSYLHSRNLLKPVVSKVFTDNFDTDSFIQVWNTDFSSGFFKNN